MNSSYSNSGSNFNSYSVPSYYNGSVYPNSIDSTNNNERFIGAGFAFPFLLGGVTGAAIAPAFWRPPYNRPYYGPYYGPYRPF